jgi:hypothetical protein
MLEAKEEPDLDDPEEPDLEEVIEDQGDLPEELARKAPPGTGNYPTLEQPPRPQVNQPISVSLSAATPLHPKED